MVEIECPEDPTWKHITVHRHRDGNEIELRLVSKESSTGDGFNLLRTASARCTAHLLLAAAESPIDGKISNEMPKVTRHASTDRIKLSLWGSKGSRGADISPSTARRVAHGLIAESFEPAVGVASGTAGSVHGTRDGADA